MAGIKVNRLTNANVYVNGTSQLGKAEEINLPEIVFKQSEHKAVGMIGMFELFSGIEKMEASIKWNAVYPDVMKEFADPRKALKLQVRGNLENYNSGGLSEEQSYIAYITGQPKNFPGGNFKQSDNVEMTSKMTITAYKLEVDGVTVMEYDALANIYSVDGVDMFATYRQNLGI